jgi:hypothetical protein
VNSSNGELKIEVSSSNSIGDRRFKV